MAKTKNRAQAMKAANPAEFAAALGHEDGGKKVRARLRNMGIHVSKDPKSFNAKAKGDLWAIFAEGKTVAKAAKAKKTSKPRNKAPKKEAATPAPAPAE